jgi:D-sedoheptulose 7-phosphate isomerase
MARTAATGMTDGESRIAERLRATAAAHERMASNGSASIARAADAMAAALRGGNKIVVFGNGGSAADAQHFVAELIVRYEQTRPARAALALTTDTSILTATGNDLLFDQVFARQIEALGRPGDVALAITTSGRSPNVLRALAAATTRGMLTIALTGRAGSEAGKLAAIDVSVAEERTALAQEVHIAVLHLFCELIDDQLKTED